MEIGDAAAFLSGWVLGALGGLVPGLHSNTIISALSSSGFDDQAISMMIIALLPAHMALSYIPSIFFGVPDPSAVMVMLPGQRMVREGQGLLALKAALASCLLATLSCVMLFPLTLGIYPIVYPILRPHMGYFLLGFSLIFLMRSRNPLMSGLVFGIAGILGQYSLNSGVPDPFLPLFCGLFAISAIASYKPGAIPDQKDLPLDIGIIAFIAIGILLGMFADLIPGVGSPSQVATFATMIFPLETIGYIATVCSISVSQAIFSLSTSASIGKSRIGGTAMLSGHMVIGDNLLILLALFMVGMALAAMIVYLIRKKVAKLAGLDFSKMNLVLAAYLFCLTAFIDGTGGILILALASVLGWATIKLGVERTNLMGAIIVPTLLLLFAIFP